jgi:hypothetical protein
MVRRRYAFLQIFKVLGLFPSFDPFKGSNPFEISHDFESFRKLLLTLFAADLQTPSSVELPLTLHTPATVVSQQVIQVKKPEVLFSLRMPCTNSVPNYTSEEMRTKAILSEILETSL